MPAPGWLFAKVGRCPVHLCAMSRIRAPRTCAEWAAYYHLRYAVLRQPWGQPPGSERSPDDDAPGTVHALLPGPNGAALAVGCLHRRPAGLGQLRFMAAAPAARGRGHGTAVLRYLESAARAAGLTGLVLHARAGAVGFYERGGYAVVAPSHPLFGCVPHLLMRKTLD